MVLVAFALVSLCWKSKLVARKNSRIFFSLSLFLAVAKPPFTILKLLCQNAQTNANNASLLVLVQLPGGSALYMQPEGTIVIAVSINASVGSYSELVDNTEVLV